MWNVRLDEAQAGIKSVGRNINNLRYADDTTLMAESKEELKSLITLGESERAEWKSWLKTQHSKMKIMASGPITLWQTDGEKMEIWQVLFSWASKSLQTVTAATKSEDKCFLAVKQRQTQTVCWKAETLLYHQQRSVQSRLWSSQWLCIVVRAGP